MKNKSNKSEPRQPINIVKGEQVEAEYKSQQIPEYRNNPLIEALPNILSVKEVSESLAYFPSYSDDQRNLPDEIRIHLLENAREFFLPQSRHIELHYSISNMLRRGYINRNPLQWGYWSDFDKKIKLMKDAADSDFEIRKFASKSKARGFAIIGGGGTGKTSGVENDLYLLPQVIIHKQYKNSDFILKQLVWLKIDCPQDGSIKGMCQEFFQTVDEILETNYFAHYGKKGSTVDEMLLSMARVAAMHSLGVFVIDEIQDLSEAKSGGAAHLLNFLVHLENRIGVPNIFIGTPKAVQLFKGEFRQARRASEQGDFYWERIPMVSDEDKKKPHQDWEDFIQTLWTYQYTKEVIPLADDILSDPVALALYHYSQGIPAIILTLFVLAQKRAILSGVEKLTVNIIKSAEKDRLNLIRQAMDSLRAGNEIEPNSLIDLDPSRFVAMKRAEKALNLKNINKGEIKDSTCNSENPPPDLENKTSDKDGDNNEDGLSTLGNSGRNGKSNSKSLNKRINKASSKTTTTDAQDLIDMTSHVVNASEFL